MKKPLERMPPVKTPKEKAERIATLRLINAAMRRVHGPDDDFCNMLDAALLLAEDTPTTEVQ